MRLMVSISAVTGNINRRNDYGNFVPDRSVADPAA
jgi:hypothetical protein